MTTDKIVNDCFPSLPDNYGKRGKAFRPYRQDAGHYLRKLKNNASVIGLGLAIALAVA